MFEKIVALDTKLFLWLNSHHSPFWDPVMFFISGKKEWIPLYLILLFCLIYRYRWQSIGIILAIIFAVTIADQLSVKAFKDIFHRLRPTHDPVIGHLVHTVNNYRGGLYGFVSNHAANSFALATFLILLFRNRYFTVFILLWAVMVSYSRIYLGVHYPGDIVGGALLGSLTGYIIFILYKQLINKYLRITSDALTF